MSFTDIFIRRPVFASVLSLMILLLGLGAFYLLPLRQYPEVSSTIIDISTSYKGASSELMEGFVSAPLENVLSSINGVDYIVSDNSPGSSEVTLYFKLGYDINTAFADVSSKIAQARWLLPKEVDDPIVEKVDPNAMPMMNIAFTSTEMRPAALTDYLQRTVLPEIGPINGIGLAAIRGMRNYQMQIWLNPNRMVSHGVTAADIRNALSQNNLQSPGGRLENQWREMNVSAVTDLKTADQFNRLVVKEKNGKLIRIHNVGRAVLGETQPQASIKINDQKGQIISIIARSDANPIAISQAVQLKLDKLKQQMPSDLKYEILSDTTQFILASIKEVRHTIFEAAFFVIAVIFLFLGSGRALLIPLVTIPLSLIGVCFLMWVMGFSLNTLTLLAFVLAIGMVVDDAIVVLENIYRHIEAGMAPIAAAIIGAREIKFAVVAMTLTLAAVYAPIGFISGVTGALFKEFAFTLAASVIISGFIALTLSPMMCSRLLSADILRGKLAHFVDEQFNRLTQYYQSLLKKILLLKKWVFGFIGLTFGACFFLYTSLPGELAPKEDIGIIMTTVRGPVGSSLKFMEKYTDQLAPIFKSIPELERYGIINFPASATGFLVLKPWEKRERSVDQIAKSLFPAFDRLTGISAFPLNPYRLPGSSGRNPVKFVIKTTGDYRELSEVMEKLEDVVKKNPGFENVNTDLKFDTPSLDIEIHRNKAASMGISTAEVGNTLNLALGRPRMGRFEMNGRSYDVIPQLERKYANRPENLNELYVRTSKGQLVPLSNLVTLKEKVTPPFLNHFQQLRAAFLIGGLAKGYSMEEAVNFLKTEASKLMKDNMQYDFSEDMRQYVEASGEMFQVFLFALIFIFLVLAAQFESFRDPLIVMFSVPLSIAGALLVLKLTGGTMNIYSQIGLVTLVGLISKHGILMVEFANELQQKGECVLDAIVTAAAIRLRPILMTTAAMVLGAVPLALASGAGAVSRQQMGWVIVGGMTFGTFLTLFVIPVVYLVLSSRKKQFTTGDAELDKRLV